jgi:hypothetical protein
MIKDAAKRAELAQKCKEWREKNKERRDAYRRKWDEENRDRKNANLRKWFKENPEKAREYDRKKKIKHAARIKAYQKQWVESKREELSAKAKIHYQGNKLKAIARASARYKEKRDEIRAATRAKYALNVEFFRERTRKWRSENLDKAIVTEARGKARRRNAPGTFTVADIRAIWERQKHLIDHIEPIARGGSNYPENLQVLCRTHNLQKTSLDPYHFAQRVGRLFL